MTNLQKGLVLHLTLDDEDISGGTAYDRAATFQPDASIGTGVTTGVSSPVGQGTQGDGTSGAFIGTRYLLSSSMDTGFTVSFWVKDVGSAGDTSGGRFLSTDLSDWWGFRRNGSVGTIEAFWNDTDSTATTFTDSFGTDTWTHYAMTFDQSGPSLTFYKNGSEINSATTGTSQWGTGSVNRYLILHDGSESGSYNTGQGILTDSGLSDVRVYHRTLTGQEISEIYQIRNQKRRYV